MKGASKGRPAGDVSRSWLAKGGDAGNRHFVDIPLKPPLELRWKAKLKMPERAIAHAGRVVVTCQGGIHALDLRTGNELWQIEERGKKSFEFVYPAGNSECVFFHARSDYRAVRWDDGRTVWSQAKKRRYTVDAENPQQSGSHLIFGNELRDLHSGEVIRNIQETCRGMADDRLVWLAKGVVECISLPEVSLVWRKKAPKFGSIYTVSNRHLITVGGDPRNLFALNMADGRELGRTANRRVAWIKGSGPNVPKRRALIETWFPAALDGDFLILWATREDQGSLPTNDLPRDYRQWAEAYSLPDFKRLWRSDAVFHQQGGDADSGSPYAGLLTRDYFWYVWRSNPPEAQKSQLTALRRQDGRVAFQCAVGPWVEHMLAVEDALIIVGSGGTVFCYGEK